MIGVLTLSAIFLSYVARKSLRTGWPYVVRQGVANLYRPANQTRSVILSLGFGAFLITTLYLVQSNLLRRFEFNAAASEANLVFFDIQDDQASGVDSMVRANGKILQTAPIVTMRISPHQRSLGRSDHYRDEGAARRGLARACARWCCGRVGDGATKGRGRSAQERCALGPASRPHRMGTQQGISIDVSRQRDERARR